MQAMDVITKFANSDKETQVAYFKTVTPAALVGGSRNKLSGKIFRVETGNALLVRGDEYEQMRQLIKTRMLREGLAPKGNFSYIRKYGTRMSKNNPLIVHKDDFYVNLIVVNQHEVKYIDDKGNPIDADMLEQVKPVAKPKQGDLKNVVYFLKTPVADIVSLKLQ